MRNILVKILSLCNIIVLISSCANRGTPSGGDKDETPPVIEKSEPENYTVNFKNKEIIIHFDEYIKFKDLQKQLIISPPMDPEPEITPLGLASKYITIRINDTLLANTTYAFNFGTSIVDNNEGNPYPYYRYVFSTGDYIDSLSVTGSVKNAFERDTDDFVSVMLYEVDSTYTDSIIYKKKPKYITNTLDSTTTFKLENLKEGKYLMVALKEKNNDYTFQQKQDKIGFLKEFITVPADTTYELNLFKEVPDYKASRPSLISGNKILFGYEGNADDMQIEILSSVPEDFQSVITKEPEKDSLNYWFTPDIKADSLLFKITNKTIIDTVTVRTRSMPKDTLTLKPFESRALRLTEDYKLQGSVPFKAIDPSKISIIDKDSLNIPFTTNLDKRNNIYKLSFNKTEENSYKIQALPGAFTDWFENKNDTLNLTTRTRSQQDYGDIRVNLQNATYPVIVQLIDKRGNVAAEQYAESPQPIDFLNILPSDYYLQVIFDTNKNRIFDTGNYLKKIQPERVSHYPPVIEVRAYSEQIITFTLL